MSSHRRTAPHTPRKPVVVDVEIERLVPGGSGLARDADGVVFVERAAVGDRCRVAVSRRGGVRHGTILEVLSASADRVAPDCDVAARCGGCDWLHLSSTAQARGKADIARDALRRVGRFADDELAGVVVDVVSPPRDAAPAQVGRRRTRVVIGADHRASYSAANSHDRVGVVGCAALHPALQQVLAALPARKLAPQTHLSLAVDDRGHVVAATSERAARSLCAAGLIAGAVVVDERDAAHDALVIGDPLLVGEITAGRFNAVADAATFAQATRHGGEAITQAVLQGVDDVLDDATVIELFCGAGHLTLPLASRARSVWAVEGDRRALRHLEHNRTLVQAAITTQAAFIDGNLALPAHVDVVVIDPPRTGIVGAAAVMAALAVLRPQRLVMVSCDPATGARDLRAAVDAGFQLRSLVPIDAFPRTHHLEWVATLAGC
jgi:23S rRNA (uracil1939-C5)-methyltransferase